MAVWQLSTGPPYATFHMYYQGVGLKSDQLEKALQNGMLATWDLNLLCQSTGPEIIVFNGRAVSKF